MAKGSSKPVHTPGSGSQAKAGAKAQAKAKPAIKVISDNRRARHEYEILEVLETGIELSGTEVKSMRLGKASLQDAFARVEKGELWLYNCHIQPYEFGNRFNHDPARRRRLL